MQARLCDVCGSVCKSSHTGKEYSLSVVDWNDTETQYYGGSGQKIDLCESCQNKLKLWIQSKGSVKL